jgi:regulator of nonsense transcripts 1
MNNDLQVENLQLPGKPALRKLAEAKRDGSELSFENERKLHAQWRKAEAEVLAAADVVCVTCIGAGDKRLRRINFPRVRSQFHDFG